MIPVNSIEIPERFVQLAGDWYNGMNDMLYAVSSTGGLTTGTTCPITDYDDGADRDRKWYLALWNDLAVDLASAARACRKQLYELKASGDWEDCDEYWDLVSDSTILDLEADYDLEEEVEEYDDDSS